MPTYAAHCSESTASKELSYGLKVPNVFTVVQLVTILLRKYCQLILFIIFPKANGLQKNAIYVTFC